MTRFAWRAFRLQAEVAAVALVILAIVVVSTAPHLIHLYNTNVVDCAANFDCGTAVDAFLRTFRVLQPALSMLTLIAPALIGIFWGAPLVARELESGTFRLAWTQSVTRRRWLLTKLAVIAAATAVAMALLSLLVSWWFHPFDLTQANRFDVSVFPLRGVVPIGYGLFALMLGVTAGLMIRRTLPAMAVTLVGFIGVRIVTTFWVRPYLFSAKHMTVPIGRGTDIGIMSTPNGASLVVGDHTIPNAWVYSTKLIDSAGNAPAKGYLQTLCPDLPVAGPAPAGGPTRAVAGPQADQAFQDCLNKVSTTFHTLVTYQPPGRYWPFQLGELAIFLALSAGLAWLSVWWVRHRLT